MTQQTELTVRDILPVQSEDFELQLIANSREQMAAAQTKLIGWAQRKIDDSLAQAEESSRSKTIALAAGFETGPFHRLPSPDLRLASRY